MLRRFEFHEPTTVGQAVALKRELGEAAAYYAGGTELLLVLKEGLVAYDHLLNLKTLPGLDGIAVDTAERRLRIGALARHAAVAASPIVRQHLPALAALADNIGNIRVRTAGTVGGNLAFAEPRSDLGALLLALEADVVTVQEGGPRRIAAALFWRGAFETALAPDEVIVAVEVRLLPPGAGAAYRKFAVSEFPTAGVAAVIELDPGRRRIRSARLAVAAVNPVPTRLAAAEASLLDQPLSVLDADARYFARLAAPDLDPADDQHGSADYKRHLVGTLLGRALRAAAAAAGAGEVGRS